MKARLAGINTTDIAKADITKNFKLPPQVNIQVQKIDGSYSALTSSDTKDLQINNNSIKVKIIATNADRGIQGVRLFNNGKSVGENIRGFKKAQTENTFEQEFTVTLTEGENTLKAVGFSDDMTESNPATAIVIYAAPKRAKPDMYILAIGINEYRNSKYNLNYCVDDMTGFVEAIAPIAKKIFGNVNAHTITNRDANRAYVLKAMEEVKSKAKAEDVFIFFYAGHGIALDVQDGEKTKSEFFYVLSEVTQMSDPQKCLQEGLSGTEMRKLLSEIKASKQAMFLDACNLGAFAAHFAMSGAAEENALAKLSRASGSVIYASTTKEQFAAEFTELKHGSFTYVLIDGLNGKACLAKGQMTVSSIKAFVDDVMPAITKKYKGEEQFPTTFIWGQDFPLGVK